MLFEQEDLIDCYTRTQAIADGVLCEVPQRLHLSAGVNWPTAFTATLWAEIKPTHEEALLGLTHEGRLLAILSGFVAAVKSRPSRGESSLLFTAQLPGAVALEVKAVVGPDDKGGPCLTFMLPEED